MADKILTEEQAKPNNIALKYKYCKYKNIFCRYSFLYEILIMVPFDRNTFFTKSTESALLHKLKCLIIYQSKV